MVSNSLLIGQKEKADIFTIGDLFGRLRFVFSVHGGAFDYFTGPASPGNLWGTWSVLYARPYLHVDNFLGSLLFQGDLLCRGTPL